MQTFFGNNCGRVDVFVFAYSCAVFGDTTILPVTESAEFKPISFYAESKLAIARYLRVFNVGTGAS